MGISTEFYILYGFLAYMSQVLIGIVVALFWLGSVVSKQNDQLAGISETIGRIEVKVDENTTALKAFANSIRRQFAAVNASAEKAPSD